MPINRDKVDLWKSDVLLSVDFYNEWFMTFAPKAFRETRISTTYRIEKALRETDNLTDISPEVLMNNPSSLSMLRMSTCPPIAVDRLIGLSKVSSNLVRSMEVGKIPKNMAKQELQRQLELIGNTIEIMADPDIFVWKKRNDKGTDEEVHRASIIIADRLCGAVANPIIRNAQEKRQLGSIKVWLENKGYRELRQNEADNFTQMPPGTFSFRYNIPIKLDNGTKVNIPVDVVIMRKNSKANDFPLLIEAKSAGDFTNTNKRRKEEAIKIHQLRQTYGHNITFDLFLCGYFDSGYLGYEAAEGIDWVWEHRIDDLEKFDL